ncbi:cytochrome C [Rhodovulum sp. BSW8]|uniref:Cytochrome c n=1 Tax=Rhodovulum visakhapatnamense TaxID=364297 RepID=A0A4V3GUF4_9RHOB|nr:MULTISPECIES: c-type cytochrome [Rhodovulum]RBO55203.1 cytochrome C [Rhodovulum sp. BSW8]TDX30551.1 cytochrome c [Rhodovulum visakhapatnamense]
MNSKFALAAAAAALIAGPALAVDVTGDPAEGEKVFNKICQTCHIVENDAGEVVAGRNAKVGPNLFKMPGRHAAAIEGFKYSDLMKEAGEKGLVWTEDELVNYVPGPTDFLREFTQDPKGRGLMTNQRVKEQEIRDVFAYIASFGTHE